MKIMRRFVLATIFVLVGGIVYANQVLALTVSPVRAEIAGDPGQILQGEIILFNEQKEIKEPRTFYSSFANFEAQGESGTPFFTDSATDLAIWIKSLRQVILKPGERKTIPYTIEIPKNAEPGGHFAVIFWSTTPPEGEGGGGQVTVGGRLGVLVLLTVNGGQVKGGGGLLEFTAKDKQRIFASLPIDFIYRFQNTSGNRIQPEGEIKIKNTFGLTSAVLPANEGHGGVLPAGIRKFTITWTGGENNEEAQVSIAQPQATSETGEKLGFFGMVGKEWKIFAFGRYTAELNLKYGQDNKETSATYSFFVIPWQLLSVVIIILGIVGFLGMLGLKRYNRWIITKAIQQQKK